MLSRLFVIIPLMLCFLLPASVAAASQFKVVKVESWDTLNMRSGPGVSNAVVVRLPHNASGLTMVGDSKTVGRTGWVQVSWQGNTGWVSKAYLGAQSAATAEQTRVSTPGQETTETILPAAQKTIIKKKYSGMWILECGNTLPSWKIEILPDWMSGRLGDQKTGMPITHKRQSHGKYHKVALETEIRGANKWNRMRMTMNYTKSCYSRLTKRTEAFSVKGMFNNTEIKGCCRALQVP